MLQKPLHGFGVLAPAISPEIYLFLIISIDKNKYGKYYY